MQKSFCALFISLTLAAAAFAGDPSETFRLGLLSYSHHSTTVAPDWTGYDKEYSGSSSLYPSVALVMAEKSYYYKMDYETLFSALCAYGGFGDITTDSAGADPSSGQRLYVMHGSGSNINRNEIGWTASTDYGILGWGLNLDVLQIGIGTGDGPFGRLSPGICMATGPEMQYFLTLPYALRVNPSVTYNWLFTNGPDKVDGWGLNFEALGAFEVLPYFYLCAGLGYDVLNFNQIDQGGVKTSSRGQLRDFALRFSVAIGNK